MPIGSCPIPAITSQRPRCRPRRTTRRSPRNAPRARPLDQRCGDSWVSTITNVTDGDSQPDDEERADRVGVDAAGRGDDERADERPDDPQDAGADGLADHHRGRPVAVHQAVAADRGAAVAADRVAEPVGDHRPDRHDPALGDRVGEVRDGEEPDPGEVERARAVAVDEPADERADEAGGHEPEAVDEAELGRAGAQGDDVDGEVREDDLVGETVERRPDDRHVPVALLPPHEGGGAAGPRDPGGGRRDQQRPARAGSVAWRRGRRSEPGVRRRGRRSGPGVRRAVGDGRHGRPTVPRARRPAIVPSVTIPSAVRSRLGPRAATALSVQPVLSRFDDQ